MIINDQDHMGMMMTFQAVGEEFVEKLGGSLLCRRRDTKTF